MSSGLMNSFEGRQQRIAEKQRIILEFLLQEVWTTAQLISELLGYSSPAAAYRTLNAMVRERLLLAHTLKLEFGRPVTLWGLTSYGLAMAQGKDDRGGVPFQPSRISMMQLNHRLDIQRLHVAAIRSGWQGWTDGNRLPFGKGEKKPDAVAVTPSGRSVAVEVERTVKSDRRYYDIVVNYITIRQKFGWDGICYFCPTEAIRERVESRIKGIRHISVHGRQATQEQVQRLLGLFEVRLYSDMR